mmetsp:Transcript_11625/g.71529  ORF Transcript_11625/g.71529 Transcript_11625/m.71529 type:complete len:243 (-) Transcript_11625:45-773(-)
MDANDSCSFLLPKIHQCDVDLCCTAYAVLVTERCFEYIHQHRLCDSQLLGGKAQLQLQVDVLALDSCRHLHAASRVDHSFGIHPHISICHVVVFALPLSCVILLPSPRQVDGGVARSIRFLPLSSGCGGWERKSTSGHPWCSTRMTFPVPCGNRCYGTLLRSSDHDGQVLTAVRCNKLCRSSLRSFAFGLTRRTSRKMWKEGGSSLEVVGMGVVILLRFDAIRRDLSPSVVSGGLHPWPRRT